MINYFFLILFIFSIVYCMIKGRAVVLVQSIMSLPYDACLLIFKMGCVLIFFQGIVEIAKNTCVIDFIKKIFGFCLKPFFISQNKEIMDYVCLNLTCNLLGIGQVATSCGIKAMELLVKENNRKDIISFLSLNVCGFCILPQTIVSLRQNYGAIGYDIVFPSIIITFLSFLFTLFLIKVFNRD